jgi:hypothetical protein
LLPSIFILGCISNALMQMFFSTQADLTSIGGLPTLLDVLQSRHASLRWRAAEVVAACVQNNPPVQALFADHGVLPLLLPLLQDKDATCRAKGLLALSCMVRGHAGSLAWLRQQDGTRMLCGLLEFQDVRVQRYGNRILYSSFFTAAASAAIFVVFFFGLFLFVFLKRPKWATGRPVDLGGLRM